MACQHLIGLGCRLGGFNVGFGRCVNRRVEMGYAFLFGVAMDVADVQPGATRARLRIDRLCGDELIAPRPVVSGLAAGFACSSSVADGTGRAVGCAGAARGRFAGLELLHWLRRWCTLLWWPLTFILLLPQYQPVRLSEMLIGPFEGNFAL